MKGSGLVKIYKTEWCSLLCIFLKKKKKEYLKIKVPAYSVFID